MSAVVQLGEYPVQLATADFRSVWERMFSSEIAVLFATSCPTAIRRAVVSVVVDAVDAMFGTWASSHVSKKVCVRVPAFADSYSSSSIVAKTLVSGIDTTISQGCPSAVFGSLLPVSTFAVHTRSSAQLLSNFATIASTRRGTTVEKKFTSDDFGNSTITETRPRRMSLHGSCLFQYNESSESLIDNAVGFHRVTVTL